MLNIMSIFVNVGQLLIAVQFNQQFHIDLEPIEFHTMHVM